MARSLTLGPTGKTARGRLRGRSFPGPSAWQRALMRAGVRAETVGDSSPSLAALAGAAALAAWMVPREVGRPRPPAPLGRARIGLWQPAARRQGGVRRRQRPGRRRLPARPAGWPAAGTASSAATSRSATTATGWRATAAPAPASPARAGPTASPRRVNGHCYWREDEPLSFDDAASRCVRGDGHLVTFADDREWREVTEQLLSGGNAPPVWIGLRKEDRNGVRDFGWVDGARVLSVHWSIQEPRRTPGGLDCGVQGIGGHLGRLDLRRAARVRLRAAGLGGRAAHRQRLPAFRRAGHLGAGPGPLRRSRGATWSRSPT